MKKGPIWGLFYTLGRGDRIRTYDPLVPNQMRYQTALRPEVDYSNPKQSGGNHDAIYCLKQVKLQFNAGDTHASRH